MFTFACESWSKEVQEVKREPKLDFTTLFQLNRLALSISISEINQTSVKNTTLMH